MSKRQREAGEELMTPKGVKAVVLPERSERGKVLARLSCSMAGCEETHVRESSDWHQSHTCRTHSRGSAAKVKPKATTPEATRRRVAVAPEHDWVDASALEKEIRTLHGARGNRHFDGYAFADYRGDKGDRGGGVVLAVAVGAGPVRLLRGVSSRKSLSAALLNILKIANESDRRVLFGQDHQYGIPLALGRELGLPTDWRAAMRELFATGPFSRGAQASVAGRFASEVNAWLLDRGDQPYFWSATNGPRYGIPNTSPRPTTHPTVKRLTETKKGFPLCRIGDPGTVGGQSIVGIPRLLDLLQDCEREGIAVALWPFDGLRLNELDGHVAIEPYPSHVREKGLVQTDENDAVASTAWAQHHDENGTLEGQLDLGALTPRDRDRVRFEGWIAGLLP